MGGWNTVQDYCNDPAGYAAHRRGYVSGTVTNRGRLLEAVADAARALREHGAVGRGADARWGTLLDALDALDEEA